MLNSEQLIAAYKTFSNKWKTLPDKECEKLFYTELGIPIPECLDPWEEFKQKFSYTRFNEEELKILFNLQDISDKIECIRNFITDISSKNTELGGNLFTYFMKSRKKI